jgi:5-methylcytosine-specific restriction protein A
MDEESLKAAARLRSGNSKTEREVVVKQIVRDPYISEYAKLRAEGVCQLCGEDAPFKDSKGRPYLESHHIIWLANGGEDSIENTVALCPNCHRKMHIVMDEKDVETLKNITRE